MSFTNADSFSGGGLAAGDAEGVVSNINSLTGTATLTGAQSASTPLTVASAGLSNGWIDAGAFDCLDLMVSSVGTGITNILIQGSNDLVNNPNGNNLTGISASSASPIIVTTVAINVHAIFPLTTRYVRAILNGTQSASTTTAGYCFKSGFAATPFATVGIVAGSAGIGGMVAVTTGGATTYRNLSVGTTGANIKGSSGSFYGGLVSNTAATVRYLKLYNKATAPTVGTDTPLMTIPIFPTSTITLPMDAVSAAFNLGIGIGASNLIADADTTAPSANDVVVNLLFV